MVRLKLTIQYDGGAYYGWQKQDGLPSVQGALEDALKQIVEHDVEVQGAGRTDRGVHAWGQVCHVDVAKDLPEIKYIGGMNRFLPDDIRVTDCEKVDESFHARYSGKARHYVYRLWNARHLRPDLAGHAGHVVQPLDWELMQAAVGLMPLGESDFKGYQDAECQSKVSLCDLFYIRWMKEADDMWRMEIAANHFLHHMVRNLVGTCVDIGLGKRPVTGLVDALEAQDRSKAGMTFEADGLYLSKVDY
ncbi:MAG: tRNA pseudouridine(38-40) synthase TruA [Alphaproteobacteria bacterium]|nr:MAG: tRNA pseudouridine(38-40) synthase TruA [Alphaproteobacteria bacterium]